MTYIDINCEIHVFVASSWMEPVWRETKYSFLSSQLFEKIIKGRKVNLSLEGARVGGFRVCAVRLASSVIRARKGDKNSLRLV